MCRDRIESSCGGYISDPKTVPCGSSGQRACRTTWSCGMIRQTLVERSLPNNLQATLKESLFGIPIPPPYSSSVIPPASGVETIATCTNANDCARWKNTTRATCCHVGNRPRRGWHGKLIGARSWTTCIDSRHGRLTGFSMGDRPLWWHCFQLPQTQSYGGSRLSTCRLSRSQTALAN